MKDTKELVCFIICLANAIGKATQDGEIDLSDAAKFWDPLSKASDAFEGLERIGDELGGASDKELRDLAAWATQEFSIPQKDVEVLVENIVNTGINIIELVKYFRK